MKNVAKKFRLLLVLTCLFVGLQGFSINDTLTYNNHSYTSVHELIQELLLEDSALTYTLNYEQKAMVNQKLAQCYLAINEPYKSIQYNNTAIYCFRVIKNVKEEASCFSSIANIYDKKLKNYTWAIGYLKQSIVLSKSIKDKIAYTEKQKYLRELKYKNKPKRRVFIG